MVLSKEVFREAIVSTTAVVDHQVKPALVHPGINANSTDYKIMLKQEKQKETIWHLDTQESVNHLLIERIVNSVNSQYPKARNKECMGFAKNTTKTLTAYIRQA